MIQNSQFTVWASDQEIMQMIRNNHTRFKGPGQVLIVKDGRLVFENILEGQIFDGYGIKSAD